MAKGFLWPLKVLGASEGVRSITRGEIDGFEGVMRVLAKFQVNLAIPKGEYGYFSTRGKG